MKIENCHPKIEDRIDLRLCPRERKYIRLNKNIAKGTRHNGPEGWVNITRSHLTVHKSLTYCNFKLNLKLKPWPNLASEYWPRKNFITSTKHQQQNTDKTSAAKSRLNINFKILTKVLNVWTKVKLSDQTSASKSAPNCCQHDPHQQP